MHEPELQTMHQRPKETAARRLAARRAFQGKRGSAERVTRAQVEAKEREDVRG